METDRRAMPWVVLALALAVVLLFDPWAVTSAGFWLSFGAVALLFYAGAGRPSRRHWLVEWGRAQWAVTLGLIPALLALFQQFSLVSPIANAVAIPAISLVITPPRVSMPRVSGVTSSKSTSLTSPLSKPA